MSMQRMIVAGLVIVFASLAGVAVSDESEPSLELVLAEVRALREQVADLETRLTAMEADKASQEEEPAILDELAGRDVDGGGGPNHALLARIELPDDPTREQVQTYVRRILQASRGQRTLASNDPQAGMLAAVGPEHVDVLLDVMASNQHGLHDGFHLIPAINQLLKEEHKPLVIDRLRRNPKLAALLTTTGWEEDAREELVAIMKRRDRFYPREFIVAVAALEEPETYDALLHYFVHGSNRSWTYEAIRDLPDLPLEEAFDDAWRRARMEGGWSARSLAPAALGRGHADALDLLIERLRAAEDRWETERTGETLRAHLDFRGSNQDLIKWYERNREHLILDEEAQKFQVHAGL